VARISSGISWEKFGSAVATYVGNRVPSISLSWMMTATGSRLRVGGVEADRVAVGMVGFGEGGRGSCGEGWGGKDTLERGGDIRER
jgi:hypothetical protein